ncbi:MAG: hypothetical protein WC709_13230 [Thermoleophilia bacterium]
MNDPSPPERVLPGKVRRELPGSYAPRYSSGAITAGSVAEAGLPVDLVGWEIMVAMWKPAA